MIELALATVRTLTPIWTGGPCTILLIINGEELVQRGTRSAQGVLRRHESRREHIILVEGIKIR